jgi:hypothetical protein
MSNTVKVLTPKQALINAHVAYLQQQRGSTMPINELVAIAKRKPRNLGKTNGITQACIDYATYMGAYCTRINVMGRKIKTDSGKEIWIKSSTKRGTPDIDLVYRSRSVKVEVKNKNTKDRLSEKQIEVRNKLQAAGAVYLAVDSFDDFYQQWHALFPADTATTQPAA